jgi:hypothetical protein
METFFNVLPGNSLSMNAEKAAEGACMLGLKI